MGCGEGKPEELGLEGPRELGAEEEGEVGSGRRPWGRRPAFLQRDRVRLMQSGGGACLP